MPNSAIGDPAVNLADLVRRAAARDASRDRPALLWRDERAGARPGSAGDDRSLTWAALDAAVDATAAGLRALHLDGSAGHPARVAIALRNTPAFVTAFFGTLRAGMVAVPVNPGLTARELLHVLTDSGAAVLTGTPELLDRLAPVEDRLPGLRHRYADRGAPVIEGLAVPVRSQVTGSPSAAGSATDTGSAMGAGSTPEGTAGEDLAVLLYTSGTEGDPKGAMLSHRALLANQAQLAELRPAPVGPDDVVLLAVPLFHAYGVNSGLGAVAYHAACGLLVDRFDAAATARAVRRQRVSVLLGVPSMYVAWAELPADPADFGSVRAAVSGAAPLDPVAARRFAELSGCELSEGYGLTETAPVLTTTLGTPVRKDACIGRPLPGVELKLVAPDGEVVWRSDGDGGPEEEFDITPGSPGTDPGEIVVRGANLFSGYWPDGRNGPDADGWWSTGDVAYADEDGDLHLVDRVDELILVNGFNVYPHEVERVLAAHPAVAGAAVIGVPDPHSGQAVKACVVRSAPVTEEDLSAHCERNLARFKCPTSIEFVERLPYSALGKVRKTVLRGGNHGG